MTTGGTSAIGSMKKSFTICRTCKAYHDQTEAHSSPCIKFSHRNHVYLQQETKNHHVLWFNFSQKADEIVDVFSNHISWGESKFSMSMFKSLKIHRKPPSRQSVCFINYDKLFTITFRTNYTFKKNIMYFYAGLFDWYLQPIWRRP